MLRTRILAGILIITAMLFAQTGTAFAAPQIQETTPIVGTISSITIETDEFGVTTVLVTVVDDLGGEQTVRLSVETAVTLGLIALDPDTMEPTVDETQIGMPVEIDPTIVMPDEEAAEESNHPISMLLAAFFGEDASIVDSYHEDGYGFGVIAQALWMSQSFSGDASLTEGILQAKTDKDFEAFFEAHPEYLAEGEAIPTNWGQFKKALSEKKNNLGSVVSGKAEKDKTEDGSATEDTQPGNGKDKNNNKSNNGKGKEKSKDKGKD